MTGALRDAPGSAAKPIKPETFYKKLGRTLLQLKTKNKKNEVEERWEEENLMLMIFGGGQGSPILYIQTPDQPPTRPLVMVVLPLLLRSADAGLLSPLKSFLQEAQWSL